MQTRQKILHIANWYPNPLDPIEGQFIKDQIDALNRFADCDVALVQVRYGPFKIVRSMASDRERLWILQLPLKSWFLKEILTSLMLWYLMRVKYDLSQYGMVNFHIAYPLLTYFHLFRNTLRLPVVITEHWSAYHFNFGTSKELPRIKRIFSNPASLITVSQSLATDIVKFSGQQIPAFQLPNVVNGSIFLPKKHGARSPVRLFMLGCWQYPKVPWIVLEALEQLRARGQRFDLRIGGYGPYENELREKIRSLGMEECAAFIGKLSFDQAANEMQNSTFFLHASEYETFSLVCAEALSCGTPVVASAVGGIPEYLHSGFGILVEKNSVECWADALTNAFQSTFDRIRIAADASAMFSAENIGMRYRGILDEINKTRNGERTI